jgi:hypothetical protein
MITDYFPAMPEDAALNVLPDAHVVPVVLMCAATNGLD